MPTKSDEPVHKVLPVADLVLDAGTQSRVAISEYTVAEYALLLEKAGEKWPFPELHIFHDGSRYLVSSGFHRTLASRRVERKTAPCLIYQGTAWDAFLHGIAANRDNPLRPNAEDKRYMIERLLDSEELLQQDIAHHVGNVLLDSEELLQQDIADMVGCGLRTVQRVVAERNKPASGGSDTNAGEPDSGGFDDDDPFGVFEDDSPPPADTTSTTTEPEPEKRTPAEELKIQKQKAVKTAEAMVRELDALQLLKKSQHHEQLMTMVQGLIPVLKNWPKG